MFQPFSFGKGFGSFEEFIINPEDFGITEDLGWYLSISGDGNIIAVSVREDSKVMLFSGRDGSFIRSINQPYPENVAFGYPVSISKDGSTLVTSDSRYPSPDIGTAYVFNMADGTLRSTINSINTSLARGWGGSSGLKVNSDGSIIQIPVELWTYYRENQLYKWRGRIFQFNTSDASFVDSFGDDDTPGISNISFAESADMNGSGSIIVSGAPWYNAAGAVYVYFKSSGIYKFVESPDPSDRYRYQFGYKVSMNEDGTRLLISEPYNGSGKVYLYDVADIESSSGSTASPILTISSPNTVNGSLFGFQAKLSGDGGTILVSESGGISYVFNSSDGSLRRTLTVQDLDPGYTGNLTSIGLIALSYNGKRAVIGQPSWEEGVSTMRNYYGGIFVYNI